MEQRTGGGNSPHMWWWRGPWRRCSTAGSTVLPTAVRQTPAAPAHKHTVLRSFGRLVCGFIRNPCCTSVYASTNSTTSLTVEHLNATYACVYVCFHVLSYRVLLLFVQREGGAQGHVGLRMERSDRDGRIRPPRSADRRLRGGRKQWRGEGVINSTTVHSNVNNKVFFFSFYRDKWPSFSSVYHYHPAVLEKKKTFPREWVVFTIPSSSSRGEYVRVLEEEGVLLCCL